MTPARIEDQYTNEPGTPQHKHRIRKIAKGLCGVHGCHVEGAICPKSGKRLSRCTFHAEAAKVYGAIYRAKSLNSP